MGAFERVERDYGEREACPFATKNLAHFAEGNIVGRAKLVHDGFESRDDVALEIVARNRHAFAAREPRTVGVITHVAELYRYFRTQIRVE